MTITSLVGFAGRESFLSTGSARRLAPTGRHCGQLVDGNLRTAEGREGGNIASRIFHKNQFAVNGRARVSLRVIASRVQDARRRRNSCFFERADRKKQRPPKPVYISIKKKKTYVRTRRNDYFA